MFLQFLTASCTGQVTLSFFVATKRERKKERLVSRNRGQLKAWPHDNPKIIY